MVIGNDTTTMQNSSASGVLNVILVTEVKYPAFTGVNVKAKISFKANTATVWNVLSFLHLCISCALGPSVT